MKLTYRLVALAALHPAIAGIAMSGRPMGSPGMGVQKAESWRIDAFTGDDKAPTIYATE
jgi:hypothetical protein